MCVAYESSASSHGRSGTRTRPGYVAEFSASSALSPPRVFAVHGGGEESAVRTDPASSGQQRLWFLEQMQPGTPLYNIPLAVRVTGPLDAAALNRAVNGLAARHEALRTTFATQ